MVRLTDTHCHLNLNQFEPDLDLVLRRAFDKGVERILIPGIDLETSRRAVELADIHPELFAAIGVLPSYANSWNSATIKEIQSLSRHPKVAAIGEIGLDYYRTYASPQEQKPVLLAQLELAAELQLPIVVHQREAMPDLWPMLEKWHAQLVHNTKGLANRPGVLHAYEGTAEYAEKAAALNFQFGLGGSITYPTAVQREEMFQQLPLQNILIETDAPYLTPQPYRGTRNEPAYVEVIIERLAKIRKQSVEEIARITSENADRLFLWRAPR